MTEQWGGLPQGEYHPPAPRRCLNCGTGWCPPGYEHCDDCLVRAVRGMNAVTRAVEQRRVASSRKAPLD